MGSDMCIRDSLRGSDQSAATQTLYQPPENKLSQAVGKTAEQRRNRKDHDRGEEVLSPPEPRREPGIERNDDDVRDQIRGDDPRTEVDGQRADLPLRPGMSVETYVSVK